MEEQIQNTEGISLIEIIRVLFHKLKLLIVVVLVGAVVGAAFAFGRTHNVEYYGTTIEFYINPEKPKDTSSSNAAANAVGSQYGVYGAYGRHVMDAIVKLLSSESFAEKLVLNGAKLPDRTKYNNISSSNHSAATDAIVAADALWAAAEEHDKHKAAAQNTLQEAWEAADQIGTFTEYAYKNLLANPGGITQDDLTALQSAYQALLRVEDARRSALQEAENAQKIADAATEVVLKEWRKTPLYQKELAFYKNSVSYSYLGDDEDIEDANNLARSFLYVKINVLNEQEAAEELLDRVMSVVPLYVEQNMIVPTDYEGTSCTPITLTNSIDQTNKNYTRNEVLKWAFLLAAASGVITAVVVIIIDQSDKRLRNHEIITKNFNVPVLGIVPTIEEMNATLENKKKNGEARK